MDELTDNLPLTCPWSIHYNHFQKFDTIKKLEEHLHTHEPRFVIRECAELIAKQSRNKEIIPLSVVDARIKELWDYIDKNYATKDTFYPTTRIEELERIKKGAIFVSLSTNELPAKGETISMARAMEMVRYYQGLEQKIRELIKWYQQSTKDSFKTYHIIN